MNSQRIYKYEQYELRYQIDQRRCGKCGIPATHMSHRISQSIVNIKKYGWEIIQHHYNLVPACCQSHNDCWNIGNNPSKSFKLIELIKTRGNEKLTSKKITEVINE